MELLSTGGRDVHMGNIRESDKFRSGTSRSAAGQECNVNGSTMYIK